MQIRSNLAQDTLKVNGRISVVSYRRKGASAQFLYEYEAGGLLLPVRTFQFLKNKVSSIAFTRSISGFMIKEENRYLIETQQKICFAGKVIRKRKSIDETGTDHFMDTGCSAKDRLDCQFNFPKSVCNIKPSFECLPSAK
jgi:hypothetical protein